HRLRSWRHRQMEAALQRRVEKEVRSGKRRKEAAAEASEFLESFESDVDQLSAVVAEGDDTDFGVDLTGDSYTEEEQASQEESQRLLDAILEDDKLTDELIDRLMKRYDSRD
ncbi:MAG: trimeric intracellular cation channel family protein, partial [Corynebacterium sp.]|nr:trimeric intracellular cation channel family protein [Corynebacterium sp.]